MRDVAQGTGNGAIPPVGVDGAPGATERVSGLPVSMYSELLMASLGGEPGPDGLEQRVASLRACRRRLDRGPAARPAVPTEQLADNVAYDRALLRLCTWLGIECDPRRFGRPLIERRHLEEELLGRGIDVEGHVGAGGA